MSDTESKPTLVVIYGATASGKSSVAFEIGKRLKAEIVSADSIQVYKKFDIGSAKPSFSLRDAVVHHMIDIVEPEEEFNIVKYRKMAEKVIYDIVSRGKQPLVVGGSGLYIKSLIERLDGASTILDDVNSEIDMILEKGGVQKLYETALKVDPLQSLKVHPNDSFRLRRIVGVYLSSGKNMRDFNSGETEPLYTPLYFNLKLDRGFLYERINDRLDKMLESGFKDEVSDLIKQGYDLSIKPMRSLGYRQLYIELTGKNQSKNILDEIKLETRHFAKRQITWSRGFKNLIDIDVTRDDDDNTIADKILTNDFFKDIV